MTMEQETTLREALQAAYPASEPSDALRRRIAVLAEGTAPTPSSQRSRRWRTGLRLAAVAATALVVFAFLLPPKLTAVQAYQRMADSVRDVRSAHYIVWNVLPNGTQVKENEVWYQKGDWRLEQIFPQYQQVQVSRNGMNWTYNTQTNTVTQDDATSIQWFDRISGFSVGALLHQAALLDEDTHVTLLGATTVAGRPAHIILLYSQWRGDRGNPQSTLWRSRIVVDDATDLPIRSEGQSRKPNQTQWVTNSVEADQYNQPIPAAVFTPDFPETARRIDAVAEREHWRERLGRGIAAQRVTPTGYAHGRPIMAVIRDFQVNAKGDVFLLFTANTEVGRDIPFGSADLTDEFGTKYLDPSRQNNGVGSQTFIPTCMDRTNSGQKVNGYVFGGEQLEGIRWVPLQTQSPWKPRWFRLTLHLDHAGGHPGTAVFDLPVQEAKAEVVPEYMPYMARPLSYYAGVQAEEEAAARASFYRDEHDLSQALAAYRELIAIRSEDARKEKSIPASSEQWLEVYYILTKMGRMEEAKAALRHAKQDDDNYVFNQSTHDRIEFALKEQGMLP